MRFTGWPPAAITWFEGIEADNSKAWFHAHRDVYDRSVRGPLEALLAEVEPEFGEGSAFRPNRDTRFSADKSPYKTSAAAVIRRPTGGSYYVQVSADGLLSGVGYYPLAKDQLERFRRGIDRDDDGTAFEDLARDLRAMRFNVDGHDPLKSAPRGYPKDHPRVEFLRLRDLLVGMNYPPRKWLATRGALDRVVGPWRAAAPLLAWMDRVVGPASEG
jgi:uncharacterized protein (TIGR02453 family)